MSTRAFIAVQEEPEVFRYIYSHFDGYPSHLGVMLAKHFDTREKAVELIDGGDISSVDDRDGVLEIDAYRDRGESWRTIKPARVSSLAEVVRASDGIDYVYLWTDETGWRCVARFGKLLPEPVQLSERAG